MIYRSFAWGCVVSALTISGAWATWSAFKSRDVDDGVVKANGRLEVQRIEIATKFAGRVLEVPVQEGDVVKVGAVIAQLDVTDLQAQLAGVQAMRQRALQAMARAQGEAQVRRIQTTVAEMEFGNALNLRKEVLVSDSEVKRRQAQRDGERAGVTIATAAIGEASAARDEADAGIKRLRIAIEDHTLRAPVAGRIEYRVVEPSSVIPAGGRVATLLDTSHVHMTIFLPAKVAGQLRVGDEARIVLDAAPQVTLLAKVSFVASEAQFTPKHVETPTEREKLTYRVKLSLSEDVAMANMGLLKAGLTGNGLVRMHTADSGW
ncbi:HlyD family efflux transporter periplasmic adaptor subunit [Aquabacterium sp.]|uniref:HlyD family secretion protein n=1 Tax=Aquabacterium sp. TaxID=1872578 RepID=UPI002489C862|nr:HlyD family efflux transporter periplasmic adaptor subunit [Aquabacterium sp.]MDI1261355.1 HlyD family efflux transporter periplasmic adaptor subunit [Aquabacterium sp.]